MLKFELNKFRCALLHNISNDRNIKRLSMQNGKSFSRNLKPSPQLAPKSFSQSCPSATWRHSTLQTGIYSVPEE